MKNHSKNFKLIFLYFLTLFCSFYINSVILNIFIDYEILNIIAYGLLFITSLFFAIYLIEKKSLKAIKKYSGWTALIFIFLLIVFRGILYNLYLIPKDFLKLQDFSYNLFHRLDWEIIIYFLFLILLILISFFIGKLNNSNPSESRKLTLIRYFYNNPNYLNIFLLFILISTQSLSEEILFRYYLLSLLSSKTSLNLSIIIILSSFLFSIAHFLSFKGINIKIVIFFFTSFSCSLLFSIVFLEYGILLAWFFHLIYNSFFISLELINKRFESIKDMES